MTNNINIEKYDSVVSPSEAKAMHNELAEMLMPLIQRLFEKGYIKNIQDSSGNIPTEVVDIASELYSIISQIKLGPHGTDIYEYFQNSSLMDVLGDNLQTEEQKKEFVEKLFEDTQNCI